LAIDDGETSSSTEPKQASKLKRSKYQTEAKQFCTLTTSTEGYALISFSETDVPLSGNPWELMVIHLVKLCHGVL